MMWFSDMPLALLGGLILLGTTTVSANNVIQSLAFNITIPATSPFLYFHDDYYIHDDQVTFRHPDNVRLLQSIFFFVGQSFCLHGDLEPEVNITKRVEIPSTPYKSNGSVCCIDLDNYSTQTVIVTSGIKSASSLVVTTGVQAPKGAEEKDLVITSKSFVDNGKVSTDPIFSFADRDALSVTDNGLAVVNTNVNITFPNNTLYFVLKGNGGSAALNATMDPAWPDVMYDFGNGDRNITNARSFGGPSPDNVLFMTPLDPTVSYTLNLAPNMTGGFNISSIELYSINEATIGNDTTRSSAKAPIGAIVGGTVAGVLGLFALIGLVAYLLHRRRVKNRKLNEKFEIEHDSSVVPFHDDPNSANSDWVSSVVNESTTGGIVTRGGAGGAKLREAGPGPSQRYVRHDNDAGAVDEELLPPMYDPSWEGSNRGPGSSSGSVMGYNVASSSSSSTATTPSVSVPPSLSGHSSTPLVFSAASTAPSASTETWPLDKKEKF